MQARGDYIRREISASRIVDGIPALDSRFESIRVRWQLARYSASPINRFVRLYRAAISIDPLTSIQLPQRPTIVPSYHESVPERALASARNSRFADESEFAEVRAKDQRTILT